MVHDNGNARTGQDADKKGTRKSRTQTSETGRVLDVEASLAIITTAKNSTDRYSLVDTYRQAE